jgi:hypothetical protein
MGATLKSRIPQIITAAEARVAAANLATAERIADGARGLVSRVSDDLHDAIHTEPDQDGVAVVAGDDQIFYGHLVEFGSVHAAPHPFLVPAAEAERGTHARAIAKAYIGL